MTEPILQVRLVSFITIKKALLNSVTLDFCQMKLQLWLDHRFGKSTLLKAINRMGDLNQRWRLQEQFFIIDTTFMGLGLILRAAKRNLVWSFNNPNPFPAIYENVVYGLRINGVKDKHILDEAVESSLKVLLSGMKWRTVSWFGYRSLWWAAATCLRSSCTYYKPKIILLDE